MRASEAELSAIDFVGDGALMECCADGFIQALQEFVDGFSITAHERGEQRLLIRSDSRSLDRCDPPERDMTTRPGKQSGDVRPAIVVLSV